MGNAARKATRAIQRPIESATLRPGVGLNKALIEDDLAEMYPGARYPLIQHATGVNVDDPKASIVPMGTLATEEDLEFSPWEGKDISRGSELAQIEPHQYIADTAYKPYGMDKAARKRLQKNPFLTRGKQGNLADLLIHNEDYAAVPGRGGQALPSFLYGNPGAMEVAAYASDGPRITRHEARHLITKPYVYEQLPANIDVSNAIARAVRELGARSDAAGLNSEDAADAAANRTLLLRQNLDSMHELIAHLGDAHDQWVRKHGRFVDTDADARAAIEEWAGTAPYSVRVEPKAKRDVILDAFHNGANDVMSRILRHMYAVPVAAGAAGASGQRQEQSPLRGLTQ